MKAVEYDAPSPHVRMKSRAEGSRERCGKPINGGFQIEGDKYRCEAFALRERLRNGLWTPFLSLRKREMYSKK